MVQLRLDRRLQGRIDPSDVLQEAYLEVARSLADYLKNPEIPFYLWVRFITSRKLASALASDAASLRSPFSRLHA